MYTDVNRTLKYSPQVAGDKPGVKIDDYWEVGKAQLQDPTKFLDSLFKYDKVSQLQSYIATVTCRHWTPFNDCCTG